MKNFIYLLLFLTQAAYAQHPGVKYKQGEMTTFYHEISKYGLENTDTLVDIGSGNGEFAAMIFKFYPDKRFMLVDLYPQFKNTYGANVTVNGKHHWFKNYREFFVGTDSTIPLPTNSFRLLLCRQTFHEFTQPAAMLAEMKRIMKDDAVLIVEEAIPEYEGQSDPNCKHLYWKKDDLVEVFESNGFRLIWSDVTMYDLKKAKGNLNILKFKKAG